jgi:lysophospholipase L1-like esterase
MKKWIAGILVFCITLHYVRSQNVEIDTVYRPRVYPTQVVQFRSYPNSDKDVIFLGNSITARTNWNELLGMPVARNRGISGDTTFGVLERLDEVYEGRPAKVFILIGINDISRNVPDKLILRNIGEIISRIRNGSPGTRVYLQTILPVNNTFNAYPRHYNKDRHILKVNEGLRAMSGETQVTLIDLHPRFLDSEGRLDKKFTDEGLHLNAEGYTLWAEILYPHLK